MANQTQSSKGGGRSKAVTRGYAPVIVLFAVTLGAAIYWARSQTRGPSVRQVERSVRGCEQAQAAFDRHQSGKWVSVIARIDRVLADSPGSFVHQRFIVRCTSGQTILVVNDLSIGQRVPATIGSRLTVRGQYVWNAAGGLIHFTHHDPEGGQGGWILFQGKVYADSRSWVRSA